MPGEAELTRPVSKKFEQLDVLRGIAILGVVLFHCLGAATGSDLLPFRGFWLDIGANTGLPWAIRYILSFGDKCVALFFVLSGFVIHYSSTTASNRSVSAYYLRRFFRIYPAYLLALILSSYLFYKGYSHDGMVKDVLLHVSLLHNFSDHSFFSINPALWSLATEVQFYILYPVLVMLAHKSTWKNIVMAAAAISFAQYIIVFVVSNGEITRTPIHWKSTSFLLFSWLLGVWLAECRAVGKAGFSKRNIWISVSAIITVAFTTNRFLEPFVFLAASVCFAAIIESSMNWQHSNNMVARIVTFLGLTSYSFYLLHQPLIGILDRKIRFVEHSSSLVHILVLFIATLAVVTPVSWILYKLVEMPFQKIGRQLSSSKANSS